MRAMFVGIPFVLLAVSTYIAYHYPVTESMAREARAILDSAAVAESKEAAVVAEG